MAFVPIPTSSSESNAFSLGTGFGEAAVHFLRFNPEGKEYHDKLTKRYGRARAMSILAHKLGRTVYFILKNKEPFSMEKFLSSG